MMNSEETIKLGTRRELFVDDYLIDTWTKDATLKLHNPEPREIALETDRPWEDSMSTYINVFQDDSRFRMYYNG